MPRFYINVRNGMGYSHDAEGRDLPDLETARNEALEGARELMAAELREGRTLRLSDTVEIEDADRRQLLILPFREAVRIEN